MDFAFNEEQRELREMARAFLAEHAAGEAVRAAMESPLGWDAALWKRIGAELGWPAVIVPEACGGLGLTYVELVALLECTGEAPLCAPFFSSVCLGAGAIQSAGSEAQQRQWLPALAEGARTAALGFPGANGRWDAEGVGATWRRAGADYRLDGVLRHVVDGAAADLLVVAARAEGSRGAAGVSLFALDAETAGVDREPLPGMDQTRRLAQLTLRDVRVPEGARLGAEGEAWPALARCLDRAAIGLAAEQVGGAQRCLDQSVAYAKERVQFGRPIGSFQAIKHCCADMMVRVEAARSAVYYAACVASEEAEGAADAGALAEAASLAKATASEAYFANAADALQIHGGVGFTWEYDVHLHLKRARAGRQLLGEPAFHRERIAARIGLRGDVR